MKKDKKILVLSALALVLLLLFSAVSASTGASPGQVKSLEEARQALEQELLTQAGVGFVGIADSEADEAITVFVENEQAGQVVPDSFYGYTVRTDVTGTIEASSAPVAEPTTVVDPQREEKVRPLVGGTSLSSYVARSGGLYLYAGTLGMVTYDDRILTNAHVIAMNPQTYEFLDSGTTVVQPGTGDGGGLGDRVGGLLTYIPIDFGPDAINYADAAISTIDDGIAAPAGEQFSEGGDYWIQGWTTVSRGDIVRKSGRTTGVTTGEVLYTNASVVVSYGSRSAYFEDLIVVGQVNYSFSQPGDSGSAVDKDGQFVGLLFAGSSDRAVVCKAQYIIDGLGIAVEPSVNERSLTISSTSGGEVAIPGEGRFIYDEGTVVDLMAVPDDHYHFVGWTGDVDEIADPSAESTAITMNGSYSITANFALDEGWYSLTTASTPGGSIIEPGEGTFVYAAGSNVSLIAEADVDRHYHFDTWTGDVGTIASVTDAVTTVVMNGSYSITANFELDAGWYSLDITSTDGGSVVNPGEGTFIYLASTNVTLLGQPEEGYEFVKWTGNVSTIGDVYAASTSIAMNSSYSITANFQSVHPEPTAQLTVSSGVGGFVGSPGEGTFTYSLGDEVNLVAEPVSGYHFTGWTGDVETIADVNSASTTITMDDSYSIVANFGSGGLQCFITTATYGTPMAGAIQTLRDFRDEYLLANPVGRALVSLYYSVSPPAAEFITEHPGLKPVVRAGLSPALAIGIMALETTRDEKIGIVSFLALTLAAVAVWVMRRRAANSGLYPKAKQEP
jgi:Divergent InlB B-repeat domain